MAEEKFNRESPWKQWAPWTELFRGFQVALDLNKLLLAAAGILVMFFGWSLLALMFRALEPSVPPDWPGKYQTNEPDAWAKFRQARQNWNLMHRAVGLSDKAVYQVADIAESREEYDLFSKLDDMEIQPGQKAIQAYLDRITELEKVPAPTKAEEKKDADAKDNKPAEAPKARIPNPRRAKEYRDKANRYAVLGRDKPAGLLSVSPWNEDRGPNPYLLATGQTGIPWEPGFFWDWFSRDQAPVMIEPLLKFVRPIIYFLSPNNTLRSRCYFLLVTVWTLVTWSIFGGALTRIAAVQLTRGDKIGAIEALQFTLRRSFSYLFAPMFPLVILTCVVLIQMLFGLVGMIPVVGDIAVSGLFWPLMLMLGVVFAVVLVGVVGWPLMAATISTEGTDCWEAFSRAYSYVYQRPWQYAWYGLVSVAYGGILIFFIGFMGSLTVYLAKWGVAIPAHTFDATSREPSFLFVHAPKSFGWRELLLDGAQVEGRDLVEQGPQQRTQAAGVGGQSRWGRINEEDLKLFRSNMTWYNQAGAAMVSFWLGLMFLLVLGFGYSYFWTASTTIYLLLRKSVDTAEMDEVYLEEDDYEPPYMAPAAPVPAAAPSAKKGHELPLVQLPPPTFAPAPVPVAAPAPAPVPAPAPPPPAEPAPVEKPKLMVVKEAPPEAPKETPTPPPPAPPEPPAEKPKEDDSAKPSA